MPEERRKVSCKVPYLDVERKPLEVKGAFEDLAVVAAVEEAARGAREHHLVFRAL